MANGEITDEMRRAWQNAQYLKLTNPADALLADALRDQVARAERAEWLAGIAQPKVADKASWQWSDWQAHAEKILRGAGMMYRLLRYFGFRKVRYGFASGRHWLEIDHVVIAQTPGDDVWLQDEKVAEIIQRIEEQP